MTQSNKRPCSNLRNEIPFDLIIEILTRLPAKSTARFRCVSKIWALTIGSPYFEDMFFTISSSRPKLLFACLKDSKTFFFSSPQAPLSLTVNTHMYFPVNCRSGVSRPVRGLVCCMDQQTNKLGKSVTVPLICNPSIGKYLPSLPRVKSTRKIMINYLGYDPVENQFKVLFMTTHFFDPTSRSEEHQIMTLGTGKKPSWRMINCDIPHTPNVWITRTKGCDGIYDGICINGILYYLARIHGSGDKIPDIICFDIRLEKFNRIKNPQVMEIVGYGGKLERTLVNHKGKLAMLQPSFVSGTCTGIELWVLEDGENHEWSNVIYVFPRLWKHVFMELYFVGMTDTNEIVLSQDNITDSFYLVYYNTVRNSVTRVYIEGMEAFKNCKVYTFIDHVEDLKRIMG